MLGPVSLHLLRTPEDDVANFIELTSSHEQRIDAYTARLYRIEIHLKRGERRAAKAQLSGLYEELYEMRRELELPWEFLVAGANLGLLSGKGALVRGRGVAIVFGTAAGWLYGQAILAPKRQFIEELMIHTAALEERLELLSSPTAEG